LKKPLPDGVDVLDGDLDNLPAHLGVLWADFIKSVWAVIYGLT
jgi:hypothetical protein